MASLARIISSLKPQPINPSSHKLLGFNYLSTQLTLKLSPTHQPFYSTTRPSNNFTTAAGQANWQTQFTQKNSPKQPDHKDKNTVNTSSGEDKIVNRPCVYAIKLEEPGGTKKNHVNSITTGVCMLWPKEKNCITTGVCMLWPKEKNFHFGEHDYVSVQGQCLNSEDTYLNVVGGSGIFKGVQGKVKLQKICIEAPVKLFYLEGIENLQNKL